MTHHQSSIQLYDQILKSYDIFKNPSAMGKYDLTHRPAYEFDTASEKYISILFSVSVAIRTSK